MGRIWVKEFTGGLDTRRLPETTPGGVLIKGQDGHINSGGEFEKRAAFVDTYTLPAGTVSLAYTRTGILVFGDGTDPGVPSGVSYQQLENPDDPGTALTDILSFDLYGGKIYVVAQYEDGSIVHFYDGVEVTDWFDGRARASFTVSAGSVTPAVAATGSFDVTGGTLGGGNQITSVKIDGVDILTGPIAHTGNNATTASALTTAINSLTSSPNYSATVVGATVTVAASATGTAANGKNIVIVVGGDATTGNVVAMQGGAAAITSKLTALTVNGVAILTGPISWATSNEATASAIASAINSLTSSPDYEATAVGEQVNIIASTAGAASNGFVVAATVADGFAVTPPSGLVLANGADASGTFVPGTFVKTIRSKVYSVSDSTWHFSGIREPTKWTTDATGAGFFDMSQETAGAEELLAVANYQGFAAVFAESVIIIMYIDPDPDLVRQSQVLSNTGTVAPQSVTQFGDSDLFYLALSGLRSLKARDSSNSAATTDLGVPVDSLITAKLAAMTVEQRKGIIGLINPVDGRFWLCFPDGTIFVFSFYPNAKVSAWTTYNTGFVIDDAVVFGRRVHIRSGNKVYVYGGLTDVTYDATIAKCWLPYLEAGKPSEFKGWQGIDAAVRGTWNVYAATQLEEAALNDQELIATISSTTFNSPRNPYNGDATHTSLRFESTGSTAAKVSAAILHYEGGEDG